MDRVLLVYAKPAVAGRVKTRLASVLGPQGAAALHDAMLRDLLDGLAGAAFRVELRWALAAGERPEEIGLPWAPQIGRDLGERLWSGLAAVASRGSLAVAVGSDHPDLPRELPEAAFAALEGQADVVLGPASDGGYYLIGLRPDSARRELFLDIPWSTPDVYSVTAARCRTLGLRVTTLAEAADVDTPEDLALLATRLAAGATCRRTRSLLARCGWGSAA